MKARVSAADQPVAVDLAAVKEVGADAAGFDSAIIAAERLSTLSADNTCEILVAMKGASPLAKNWLRIIAADVADNEAFPRDLLLSFFEDRSQDDDARYATFQMLIANDPTLKATLLENAADDPSLPIRFAAIAKLLDAASQSKLDNDNETAEKLYLTIIKYGRNPDQLQSATKALADLGKTIDLADELGLIRRWWAIGTFDNTASAKFDFAYTPETIFSGQRRLPPNWLKEDSVVVNENGDRDPATTHLVTSDDSYGVVNINPTFKNAKDAIAYCYVEFDVDVDVAAIARLGCITASKVWVNGKLVMANQVYHSGSRIDQYTGDCDLVKGTNSVLIKICQNAQTEPWAQDWQFQFRLTDRFGAAVKPSQIVQPPTQ